MRELNCRVLPLKARRWPLLCLLWLLICILYVLPLGCATHLGLGLQSGAIIAGHCSAGAYALPHGNENITNKWLTTPIANSAVAVLNADGTDVVVRSAVLQPPLPPLGQGY
ncbi:hypothetical protein Vafri_6005, partial [Volvox africanus]